VRVDESGMSGGDVKRELPQGKGKPTWQAELPLTHGGRLQRLLIIYRNQFLFLTGNDAGDVFMKFVVMFWGN
jgi:hypothetical protein